ncbi:MAG: hypothetical protein ACRCYP_06140, partial [Alphaproteobacteria bacterium]
NKMAVELEKAGLAIPDIRDFERAAFGMSGAAALLTEKLVYKTDINDPEKIASKQEVGAYERLAGRYAPKLYKAQPGEFLVTERIKGTPLKDVLDEMAAPAKALQQNIKNITASIRETDDKAVKSDLVGKLKDARREYAKARNEFNAEAERIYFQVGQLGKTLQEMGVAHGDLASGNVFKTNEGLKSIDLGNSILDPTNTQKIQDQVTTIQRALIDRAYYGLLDPIRTTKAIVAGYKGPSLPSIEASPVDESLLTPERAGSPVPLGSTQGRVLDTFFENFQAITQSVAKEREISTQGLDNVIQAVEESIQAVENSIESIPPAIDNVVSKIQEKTQDLVEAGLELEQRMFGKFPQQYRSFIAEQLRETAALTKQYGGIVLRDKVAPAVGGVLQGGANLLRTGYGFAQGAENTLLGAAPFGLGKAAKFVTQMALPPLLLAMGEHLPAVGGGVKLLNAG